MICNAVSQRGRYNAAHSNGAFRDIALSATGLKNIIQKHKAELIAGEFFETVAIRNRNRNTISIWIGAKNNITGNLCCDLIALIQGCICFGIGVLASFEIAVRLFLAFYNRNIYSQPTKNLTHRLITGSTQRGIDDVQTGCFQHLRINSLSQNGLIVLLPNILTNIANNAFPHICFKALAFRNKERNRADLFSNNCSRLISHLTSVGAIALNTIVSTCVVAGRNNNTASAAQFTNSKGKHGSGCKAIVQPCLNTSLSESNSTDLCKKLRIVSGIIADCSHLWQIRSGEPRCHTLCCSAYSIAIQAITASTHNTAHAGSTKLQVTSKTALQFFIIMLNCRQFGLYIGREIGIAPEVITIHVVHSFTPPVIIVIIQKSLMRKFKCYTSALILATPDFFSWASAKALNLAWVSRTSAKHGAIASSVRVRASDI